MINFVVQMGSSQTWVEDETATNANEARAGEVGKFCHGCG